MHKVLVIDDNPDILDVVETLLTMHNISTCLVSEGREVLDAIESFRPDLILLDIKLGDIDGRSICKQLKTHSFTCHIPVIIFSGLHGIDQSLADCGMVDFIFKPFDMEELINKINKHIPSKILPEDINKKVVQIIVDTLGVNYNECLPESQLRKDLGADLRDLITIYSSCEKIYGLSRLKKRFEKEITVNDLVNTIYQLLYPQTNNKSDESVKSTKPVKWKWDLYDLKKKFTLPK